MSVCSHCWNLACERARATDALDGITPIYTKILTEQEALGEKAQCQSVRARAVVTAHGIAELPPLKKVHREPSRCPDDYGSRLAARCVNGPETEMVIEGAWGDGYIAGARDVTRKVTALREAAWQVMSVLRRHGASVIPHLLDSDDNAGQRLRDLVGERPSLTELSEEGAR